MGAYQDVFGGSPVQPSHVAYRAIALSANASLSWPQANINTANVVARINDVTPSAGSLSLTMPDATQVSPGQDALFSNLGASSYTILANDGSSIVTVATSTVVYIYLVDNSTAAGTWRVTQFGATAAAPDANSLAGNGLTVITAKLNTAHPVTSLSVTPTTIDATYRAKTVVWTGGAGTLNLTASATLGNNFFFLVTNQGTGVLTLTPNGSETIDGSASATLNQQESLIAITNGSNFFTVGHGRTVSSSTTRLLKSVAGNTDVTLSAVEAANQIIEFTGALTGNINVIFPVTVATYFLLNNTSGAFSLTAKTAAGTGIAIEAADRVIVHCDGTNIVRSITQPLPVAVNAQTGTTYTVLASDFGKLVTHTNGSAIAVTLPQAGTAGSFGAGFYLWAENRGAGTVTITPTTSTIDGAASLALATNQGCMIVSDGTNYFTMRGLGLVDPTTTRGDIITRGASAPQRLALGSNGAVLSSNGTDAVWLAPAGMSQGRLTLTSATPVLSADATAQATVYYTPFIGNFIPIYNGSSFVNTTFSELSIALDSNAAHSGYQQSGKNFDFFVYNDSGTIRLGTGPTWNAGAVAGSDTARGTGAGSTELQQLNGIWTNKNSITLRFGSVSGNTTSVSANQATYVGTMRTTADGQTGMAFKPTAAGGGTNNVLGLWNAYNRVRVAAYSRDSTSSWTYSGGTWRVANAGGTGSGLNNRVSWVDGLQQSRAEATYAVAARPGTTVGGSNSVGVNFNSTSATPSGEQGYSDTSSTTSDVTSGTITSYDNTILLGFNFAQAMEQVPTDTSTFFGSPRQALILSLEM